MPGITPTSGPVAIARTAFGTIPGVNWKITYDPKITTAASNFRDGRRKNVTLFDGQLTFKVVWDASSPPTLAAGFNFRPGVALSVSCFTDATNFFLFPGIFGPLTPENPGLEEILGMEVTVEYDQTVGTFTYPLNG